MPKASTESFTVTCACGTTINTDLSHVGRTIRCRCGRSLTIAAPASADAERSAREDLLFRKSDAKSGGRRKRFVAREETQPRPGAAHAASSTRTSRVAAGFGRRLGEWPVRYVSSLWNGATRGGVLERGTIWLVLLVLVGMIGAWWLLVNSSEELVPATYLAYGPRWLAAISVGAVTLLALVFARAALPFALIAAWVAVVPFMGFRWHPGRESAPPALVASGTVRVLTFNTDGNAVDRRSFMEVLDRYRPSVVAVQECGQSLRDTIATLTEWHTDRYMDLCILSRWNLGPRDSMPRAAFQRLKSLGYGGAAMAVRYRVAHPARPFDFVALHLETPRKGLERLVGNEGFLPDGSSRTTTEDGEAFDAFRFNAQIRRMESERASVWSTLHVDETPVIVAGDFNQPVESTIFQRFWSRLDDAFERSGVGFGYTKRDVRSIRVRIDHVLFSARWFEARGSWVGPDVGSDHQPVIADLRAIN